MCSRLDTRLGSLGGCLGNGVEAVVSPTVLPIWAEEGVGGKAHVGERVELWGCAKSARRWLKACSSDSGEADMMNDSEDDSECVSR